MENPQNIKLHIEISEKHIKNGKPCSSEDCPVALAILDAVERHFDHKRMTFVHVTINWIIVVVIESLEVVQHYSCRIPGEVFEWISAFDSETKFTPLVPFMFDLTLNRA